MTPTFAMATVGEGALSLSGPLGLEIALGALILLVFLLGLFRPAVPDRRTGWVSLIGLIGLSAWSFFLEPGGTMFDGSFTVDPLALFTQRLFLVSAAVSVLATLGLPEERFARRGSEYHVALLASLLGMLVLAAARELILLFVAFELMSIPLYFLTGFLKRDDVAKVLAPLVERAIEAGYFSRCHPGPEVDSIGDV